MTKPNWNRIAALEFAGRVLMGRTDIGAGEAQAHADWALQWLGGDQPNSERPPGGWVTLPNPTVETDLTARVIGLPDDRIARAVQDLGEARQRIVGVFQDTTLEDGTEHRELAGVQEAPPRNVPTVGDGSMTVPVYRFYREFRRLIERQPGGGLEPEGRQEVTGVDVFYWREDTRNETGRWSLWSGPEPENGIPCWVSRRDYDQGGQYAPPPVDQMLRLSPERLAELDIPAETRYDSEE